MGKPRVTELRLTTPRAMTAKNLLVTSALPYANGPIHLGHLVEYVMTDIYVRYWRLRGRRTTYVCADDTHGTAIMMRARQEGREPEALLEEMSKAHQRDLAAFGVSFDHYGSTHSKTNQAQCNGIWKALVDADMIEKRSVNRLFDEQEGIFLADRFVRGTCPKCSSPEQYGDSCDKCGSTYSATDVKDPVSTLSGTKPVLRPTDQLFVKIAQVQDFLRTWVETPQAEGGALQTEVRNYLLGNFLGEPLQDWDVSRPEPYFGFEIPGNPGQFWYVWFDAPVGYIAATEEWCAKHGENLDDWWRNEQTEIHHFLGKDITYFHTLFWPAMLKTAGFSLPSKVQIHGFLRFEGEKMSKSKGTFIAAETFAKHVDPELLRYYYASKVGPKIDDLDFGIEEFTGKVNADLVGRVANLASRSAKFAGRTGLSAQYPTDEGLFVQGAEAGTAVAKAYEACDFREATRLIMVLADRANEWVERMAPWKLAKDPEQAAALQDVCTVVLNLYRQLVIYLAPAVPDLVSRSEAFLGAGHMARWEDAAQPLCGTPVGPFKHLYRRVEAKSVEAAIAETASAHQSTTPTAQSTPATTMETADPIAAATDFETFCTTDLRAGTVLEAAKHESADRLLVLRVDLGFEVRTIVAGVAASYAPEDLAGQRVVVVANLPPRKLRGVESQGMILAADDSDGKPRFIAPADSVPNGTRIS